MKAESWRGLEAWGWARPLLLGLLVAAAGTLLLLAPRWDQWQQLLLKEHALRTGHEVIPEPSPLASQMIRARRLHEALQAWEGAEDAGEETSDQVGRLFAAGRRLGVEVAFRQTLPEAGRAAAASPQGAQPGQVTLVGEFHALESLLQHWAATASAPRLQLMKLSARPEALAGPASRRSPAVVAELAWYSASATPTGPALAAAVRVDQPPMPPATPGLGHDHAGFGMKQGPRPSWINDPFQSARLRAPVETQGPPASQPAGVPPRYRDLMLAGVVERQGIRWAMVRWNERWMRLRSGMRLEDDGALVRQVHPSALELVLPGGQGLCLDVTALPKPPGSCL